MKEKLKIGDAIDYLEINPDGKELRESKTVVEIVLKPRDEYEAARLGSNLWTEVTENQSVLNGADLADDPRFKGKANPDAFYIVER